MKISLLSILLFFYNLTIAQSDFSQLDKVLSENAKNMGGKYSMLVYKGGKLVYEKNSGGYTKSTIEPVASCSKWFTAAMVMTFVEEGKLSLNDTLGKYLPLFSKNGKGKITIGQCLSHTTGIQGEKITVETILGRSKYKSLEEEVNDFASKPMAAKPGSQFFYGSIGCNIAGRILEVISGRTFEAIFQERIAGPLEMKNTTFVNKHAINPSGGASSTPSDYMNFLIMILNKGEFKGKRILKESSIEVMQKDWTKNVTTSYVPEEAADYQYGLGEWILEKDEFNATTVVSSPGLFGTFPYVDTYNDYCAILFIHSYTFKNRKLVYSKIKASIDDTMEE